MTRQHAMISITDASGLIHDEHRPRQDGPAPPKNAYLRQNTVSEPASGDALIGAQSSDLCSDQILDEDGEGREITR